MLAGSRDARASSGEPVAGRFEMGELLGSGGMGDVYRALDRETGVAVALKLVPVAGAAHRARFDREASLLAELRHPAIVRYVAHGEAGGGALYLAMELLEGENLAARIARGPLDVGDALDLVRRVADALGEAHARGVVHRDLKPENLFLPVGDVRRATVIDFGIAHAVAASRRLTATGTVIGTPGYMAPEQARAGAVLTPRVDVFALGCVLYECLAGRPAFQGDHVVAILAKLLFEEPVPLREMAPHVPPGVEALVVRMLSKDPSLRPGDGSAVRDAVDLVARGGAVGDAKRTGEAPAPRGLTLDEQGFINVVLVGAGALAASRASTVDLAAIAGRFGTREARLVDGSLVVTSLSGGEATDRAVRAARCALALRAALPGALLSVAAGRAAEGARGPVGEVIERAASLLEAARTEAPSSRVVVDETTAALLPVRFLVERDRGLYVLLAERDVANATRTLFGRPTPFVGRERELATLRAAFEQAALEPGARVALVVGEPGAGKSRLREELLDAIRGAAPDVIFGGGDPLRSSSPFGLLAGALRRRFGLAGSAGIDAQHAALSRRVAEDVGSGDAPRVAGFLAEIAGCPAPEGEAAVAAARRDPALMGAELARAWVDYLRAVTAKGPAVIVLEDLHWADAASVRLCDAALRSLRDRPLFVLALARPDVDSALPRLFAGRGATRLELGELGPRASEAMIRALWPGAPSDGDVERLQAQAAGNPLHVEELIRATSLPGSGHRGGPAPEPPGSLLAILAARLSAYDEETRRVLRAASVLGQTFAREGVQALLGAGVGVQEVRAALDTLLDREVIVAAEASPTGDLAELSFRHGLVRDAAYAMLTEADRALGHLLAGAFLEARPRQDATLLGRHFELGGDRGRAARWYAAAAGEALDGNDLDAALAVADRAVDCGAVGALLGGVRRVQAEACSWKGDYARSQEHGREALELLQKGTAAHFEALATYVTASDKLGAPDEVLRVVDALAGVSPRGDTTTAFLEALARTAAHLMASGKLAPAEKLFSAIDRHADGAAGPTLARITHARAVRAFSGGDVVRFLELETRASSGFAEAGDARSACATQSNAGYAGLELGDYERAERLLRGALATATTLGLSNTGAFALHNLGLCLALRGDLAEGARLERESLEYARSQGDRRLLAGASGVLARIALLSGDAGHAEAACREALAAAEDASPVRMTTLAILASSLLVAGRPDDALEEASEAMCMLSEPGLVDGEALVRLAYAEALHASGDRAGALAELRTLHGKLQARAEAITDPSLRESFLGRVPENARAAALLAVWSAEAAD